MWSALKCNLCGDCLVRCQYINYDKARAVAEIKLLLEGKEAEILNECMACMACREYCPAGADPFDLICKMQEQTGTSRFNKDESVYLDHPLLKEPSGLIPGDPDKPVLSLSLSAPIIPDGALTGQLFEGLSIVKGSKYFGYFGMVRYGKESLVKKSAQKFIDLMTSLNKEIIFLQDDCYAMVHAKVKDYGITVPFKYMHLLDYLRNYLRDHPGNIIKLGKKVACQRPCSSRYSPEKYALLDQILELIGVERPERKYDRENALCCFSKSAGLYSTFPELADEYQTRNIKDALESGSEAMIAICPGCYQTLQEPAAKLGLNIIFITDLCRMALGEKSWPES